MANSTPHEATHYRSGESIRAGDRVDYAGSPGVIECVLGADCPPGHEWYAEQFGHGFLVLTERWGPIFMHESDEDLELVARAEPAVRPHPPSAGGAAPG